MQNYQPCPVALIYSTMYSARREHDWLCCFRHAECLHYAESITILRLEGISAVMPPSSDTHLVIYEISQLTWLFHHHPDSPPAEMAHAFQMKSIVGKLIRLSAPVARLEVHAQSPTTKTAVPLLQIAHRRYSETPAAPTRHGRYTIMAGTFAVHPARSDIMRR